jgi:hypothetical protein
MGGTVSALRDRLRTFVDHRLQSLVTTPEVWGSPESVELQVLQMLQVRALVLVPEQGDRDPGATREHYVSFLRARFPDAPPMPLAQHVAADASLERFVEILRQFIEEERARQKVPSRGGSPPTSSGSSASEPVEMPAKMIEAHGRFSYKRSRAHRPFLDAV